VEEEKLPRPAFCASHLPPTGRRGLSRARPRPVSRSGCLYMLRCHPQSRSSLRWCPIRFLPVQKNQHSLYLCRRNKVI